MMMDNPKWQTSFGCCSGSADPEAMRCMELCRNTDTLEESAKG